MEELRGSALWWALYRRLMLEARIAGVPVWRRDRLFHEMCDAQIAGMRKAYSDPPYILSEGCFDDLVRSATRIPLLRPDGAGEAAVRRLATVLRNSVMLLLTRDCGIPFENDGDAMIFVA